MVFTNLGCTLINITGLYFKPNLTFWICSHIIRLKQCTCHIFRTHQQYLLGSYWPFLHCIVKWYPDILILHFSAPPIDMQKNTHMYIYIYTAINMHTNIYEQEIHIYTLFTYTVARLYTCTYGLYICTYSDLYLVYKAIGQYIWYICIHRFKIGSARCK